MQTFAYVRVLFVGFKRFVNLSALSLLSMCCLLGGCTASAPKLSEGLGNMGDKVLETIGYKKPEVPKVPELPEIPEAAKPDRTVNLRIAASESLNVDPSGNALSLVVRVYKLRNTTAFLAAPYETFGNVAREKEVLTDSLIEAREMVLLPGGQQQLKERWARDASYVGVVALYRVSNSTGWRFAFDLEAASSGDGLVVGAHACSLSVASGQNVRLAKAALPASTPSCPIRQIQKTADQSTEASLPASAVGSQPANNKPSN
jgi:type VI secretion system protein VasD